jgi:RNA polymerase sigma factor (sigma-70 family)
MCLINRKLDNHKWKPYTPTNITTWWLSARQGSKKACYELYRLYSKAMLNVAFRIVGDIAEAEDVLQEAFLHAFNKVVEFRQETTFGLWLKQIVVSRSINMLRKRKMEFANLEDDALENIPDEVAEDDDETQYKVAQVKEAMKELPEGYRVGNIPLPA